MALIDPLALGDLGFVASQFGSPADWLAAEGYLERLIAEQSARLRARVGALYDTADTASATQLRAAELHLCAAELWDRRAVLYDAEVVMARGGEQPAALLRQFRANADAERQLAEAAIAAAAAAAGIDLGGALAVGYVETGSYPAVAPA